MNGPHDFDALARQKLEQRAFPFDEADQADVERMLQQRKRRRRGAWWFAIAAGLLLLSGGLYVATRHDAHAPQLAHENTAMPAAEGAAESTTDKNASTSAARPVAPSADIPAVNASGTATAPPSNNEFPTSTEQPHAETPKNNTPSPASAPAVKPTVHVNAPAIAATASIATRKRSVENKAAEKTPTTAENKPASAATPATENAAMPSSSNAVVPPAVQANNDPDRMTAPLVKTSASLSTATNEPSSGTTTQNTANTTVPTTTTEENKSIATEAPYVASVPQDSTLTTATAAPVASPCDKRTEWSLLGGLLMANVNYNGGSSEQWKNDVHGSNKPAFGVELARMGEHFGYGGGLHYIEYAEQLNVQELTNTDETYSVHYHLMPIDTVVTIVTDTIYEQGIAYYVTQQVGTTIHVLGSETDTARVIRQVRAAREIVNSVRYFEVPVFADVHTTWGQWTIGVRGGPSFGFLSGRRGALPNETFTGYTDLGDVPFNTMVFGYQARAYIRYRLGADWALGLEPTVRGQFGDAFQNAGITRKASGLGGFISLSYTLPCAGR